MLLALRSGLRCATLAPQGVMPLLARCFSAVGSGAAAGTSGAAAAPTVPTGFTDHERSLYIHKDEPVLARPIDVGYRFGVKEEELEVCVGCVWGRREILCTPQAWGIVCCVITRRSAVRGGVDGELCAPLLPRLGPQSPCGPFPHPRPRRQ
jgi:hypothetical protein